MNVQPYYVTLADFGGLGRGHACDPASFDDACDAYAEKRDQGLDAAVFRVEPPKGDQSGMMFDVTADAEHRIAARLRLRGVAAE